LTGHGQRWAYHLNVLAIACMLLPLIGALAIQAAGDLPCPLCLLQRIAMFAVIIGLVSNLKVGLRPAHYGLSIAGALSGMAISTRQVLLHINDGPGGGYGGSVLGLHLYTWALIVFVCFLIGTAVLLMIPGSFDRGEEASAGTTSWSTNRPARLISYFALGLCVVNAVMALALCGPGQCPDNPTGYWIAGG